MRGMILASRQKLPAVPTSEVASFFDEPAAATRQEMDEAVGIILNHPEGLSKTQLIDLAVILKDYAGDVLEFNADFDLLGEVSEQLKALRAMRGKVMINGMARTDVSARDLKEVVTASNTILQTLMKSQDQLVNQDRLRAIEKATVAAIEQQTPEVQDAFFAALTLELAAIK